MRVAIVGCGFAADHYAATLPNHPELEVAGVYDRDAKRRCMFSEHYGFPAYPSFSSILSDESIVIVVNLTNPSSHAEITQRALEAGKHVYTEKPLALDLSDARDLVELAERRHLTLCAAPCNLLGEAAQTAWRLLRSGAVGTPHLVYAELDDGPILRMPYAEWTSPSGASWPYLDEFRTGCTIEHAAYYLNWLTAFFGPVAEMTAYAANTMPNPHLGVAEAAPDFTSACMRFRSGVVARLTSSFTAPVSRLISVMGGDGALTVQDCWDYGSQITVRRWQDDVTVACPLVRKAEYAHRYAGVHNMDFARGIAQQAHCITIGAPLSQLPTRQALHVLEVVLAMATASGGVVFRPETDFPQVQPMPWAL